MSYRVRPTQLAADDLIALHRWVSGEADRETADRYLDRLRTLIASLSDFPNRGTPRDDFSPGARTIVFERRIIVVYQVEKRVVRVLRVINGAREIGRLMGE